MKTSMLLRTPLLALCGALLVGAGPTSPSLPITAAFISAGGGAGSFSAVRAFTNLIGVLPLQSELDNLRAKFGQEDVDRFLRAMDFAINDGWKRAGQHDVKIPPPSGDAGKTLVVDMVKAGTPPSGAFSMSAMMDALLTSEVASQVGTDLAARYGADAVPNFERVGTQFFSDIAQSS